MRFKRKRAAPDHEIGGKAVTPEQPLSDDGTLKTGDPLQVPDARFIDSPDNLLRVERRHPPRRDGATRDPIVEAGEATETERVERHETEPRIRGRRRTASCLSRVTPRHGRGSSMTRPRLVSAATKSATSRSARSFEI